MWAQKLANIRYTEVKKKLLEILSLYSSLLLAFSAGNALFKGRLCHFSDSHSTTREKHKAHSQKLSTSASPGQNSFPAELCHMTTLHSCLCLVFAARSQRSQS